MVNLDNCIVAGNHGGEGAFSDGSLLELSCCDLFGNDGGDWVGPIAGQLGQNGNIREDPLFCHPGTGDFFLQPGSPCAPEHNPDCGLLGAWPVGCGASGAAEALAGRIQRAAPNPFRDRTRFYLSAGAGPDPGSGTEVGSMAVRAETIEILDVAGRLVRRLAVADAGAGAAAGGPHAAIAIAPGGGDGATIALAAGDRSLGGRVVVEWDGRTSEGSPAAAGVYFVRCREARSGPALRVIRIR